MGGRTYDVQLWTRPMRATALNSVENMLIDTSTGQRYAWRTSPRSACCRRPI